MARRLLARECTQKELAAWLGSEHHIPVSPRGVSRWFAGYRKQRRAALNQALVEINLAEFRKRNPDATDDEIFDFGQRMFSLLALEKKDIKTWATTQGVTTRRRQVKVSESKRADESAEKKAKIAAVTIASNDSENDGGLPPETVALLERELKLL